MNIHVAAPGTPTAYAFNQGTDCFGVLPSPQTATRAITEALPQHLPYLRRLAGRLVREEDLDDLVHDAVERALSKSSHLSSSRNLRPWLVAILRNLRTDQLRRRQRWPQLVPYDAVHMDATQPREVEAQSNLRNLNYEQIERAVRRLPEVLRTTFTLCALDGCSYREAARKQGIRVSTVGSRLTRARHKLRSHLLREAPCAERV